MLHIKKDILTNKFVKLIEENYQVIVEHFMNDVLKNEKTSAFRRFDQQKLYEIGQRICRELSSYVIKDLPKEKVEEYYIKIGKERHSQNVPASHVFHALVILKRHMWLFVRKRMESDLSDYSQALHLNDRIVLFFDRASFAMLKGYEEEMEKMW